MTQIKKLKNSQGVQVYPQTHTKAVIDDNGYTVESRMQAVQDVVNQAQMAIGAVPSDLTPTEDSANWVTSGGVYNAIQVVQSDVTELESQFGYYKWETASNTISITTNNQVAGSPIGSYVLTSGGSFKIKMTNKATGACTLNMNGTGAKPLLYNGNPIDSSNTWEDGEVISVYYDGTNYQANNVAGGSKPTFGIKSNVTFDGYNVVITYLSFVYANDVIVHIIDEETSFSMNHDPSYLIYNRDTKNIHVITSNKNLSNDVVILLYRSGNEYQSGLLYEKYILNKIPNVLMQDTSNSNIVSITINDKTEKVAKESSVIYNIAYSNSIEWTNNKGIYYKDGSERDSTTQKCSDYIDVSNFTSFRYSRVKITVSSIFGAAFYDANYTYISGIQCKDNQDEKGVESYVVNNIPSSAKYVRFTYWMDTATYGDFELIILLPIKEKLQEDITELQDSLKTVVIAENPSLTQGGVYADEGNIDQATSTGYTDYINISDFVGTALKYKRMCLTSTTGYGIAFYDENKNYISGVRSKQNCTEKGYEYYETLIPSNASYARFSCWLDTETYGTFNASVILDDYIPNFFLGKIENLDSRVLALEHSEETETIYTPTECRNRFYKAMLERCANYNIQDVIIEGPSGYGLGGEVENEVLGHGMSNIPIYGILKIALIASSYSVLCEVMSEDKHIIYTKGVETALTVQRSIYSSAYSNSLTDYYQVLFCKTGSMANVAINLSAICDSPDFGGNLLLGVVSTNLSGDSNTKSRYKAMKILMDIGKAKLINKDADVSSLEADLIAQQTRSAAVIIVPKSNTKMYYKTDFINSQYNLYSYNGTMVINPMSMIKYLAAMVTLDYIKDIDEYVKIIQNDITAATGGSGAIFAVNEKVTYRDLIYAMMSPSSNQAGYILARKCGQFLLENYRGDGFLPEGTT